MCMNKIKNITYSYGKNEYLKIQKVITHNTNFMGIDDENSYETTI